MLTWIYHGELKTSVFAIIPVLLYLSKSEITNPGGGGVVYALHITPFISLGVNWKRGWNASPSETE